MSALGVVAAQNSRTPGAALMRADAPDATAADATGGETGPSIIAQLGVRNDGDLAAFLRAGKPASGMPAFDLADPEMGPLVAYLRSLVPISRTAPPSLEIKTVTTTTGAVLQGRVVNEGTLDLQLRDGDRVYLLRKAGDRYRLVTSQTDWPTYHGDPSGNRYSKLTQIDKTNVGRLTARWMFPLPNVSTIENTPVVVEGIMYVSSANECYGLDAGTGRMLWHYQRPRTKGLAGNAASGDLTAGSPRLEIAFSCLPTTPI